MKRMNRVLSLMIPVLALGAATASRARAAEEIEFDGSSLRVDRDLVAPVMAEQYDYRDVEELCHRSVEDGSDEVCKQVQEEQCDPSGQCRWVTTSQCTQVPRYRTEAYYCTRTETIPLGKRKIGEFRVSLHVVFSGVPEGIRPREVLDIRLDPDAGEIALQDGYSSGRVLLLQTAKRVKRLDRGDDRSANRALDVTIEIAVLDAKAVRRTAERGFRDGEAEGRLISFRVPTDLPEGLYGPPRARIIQDRFWDRDREIFSGPVPKEVWEQDGDRVRMRVTALLPSTDALIHGARYKVEVRREVTRDLLNPRVLGKKASKLARAFKGLRLK